MKDPIFRSLRQAESFRGVERIDVFDDLTITIENAGRDKGSVTTRATLTPSDALRLAAALIYAAHGQLSHQQGML